MEIEYVHDPCPCEKDCQRRSSDCHAKCKEYNEWSDRRKAKLEQIGKEKRKRDCHSKMYQKNYNKSLRRR